jgi:ParB family chromosome partitioning protein
MASTKKITLSPSCDIPFDKLVLSQSNVRQIVKGVSIKDLAEDIAQRSLLQGLNVRPILDGDGKETGTYEIPAGGRRYRALELLVKQKRMSKTQLVPCVVVRTGGLAEEDSLAENVHREDLHPLDQFRAFQALREKGMPEEDIAARFFISVTVVQRRLKLASVSPKLLDVYAAEGMTLEQLMAFTVTDDHRRQEEVWDQVFHTGGSITEPHNIRRKLTEGAIRASDKRALFVGIDAYEAAGGVVTRDLFHHDEGGWLQDPALLDRLVTAKLKTEADKMQAEGWNWIAAATDLPYSHIAGMRQIHGRTIDPTEQEIEARNTLEAEFNALEQQYADVDDVPEDVHLRFEEIETALAALDDRPVTYDPAEIALAGAFVSIDRDGALRIERGYVRPEDEPQTEPGQAHGPESAKPDRKPAGVIGAVQRAVISIGAGDTPELEADTEEDEGLKPLSERLLTELTSHRTLALRDALANNPGAAFTAVLHALCLSAFYRAASGTCLEISVQSTSFGIQAPGLADSPSAKAIEARHQQWARRLPKAATDLWDALVALDSDSQATLFAHCASLSINAVHDPSNRHSRRIAHADALAGAVNLDMAEAGWSPTVENFLIRVPKARIREAVREAKGDAAVQLIDDLKKSDMAKEAERLLSGTGWLPEPLRTPDVPVEEAECEFDAEDLPAFLHEDDDAESYEAAAE